MFKKMGLSAQTVVVMALMASGDALAGTAGNAAVMPWDNALSNIEGDLSGTVAHAFIIIAIVVTGLMWAFGEHGSSMRKVMGIAAGGAMALGASSAVISLTGGASALIGF